MGKIVKTLEVEYDVGDVVIFKKSEALEVGIVEGYYEEDGCIWYNIRVTPTFVYTYSNCGDIAEFDIVGKVSSDIVEECGNFIIKGDN